jgi:hypothetical protein
VVPGRRALAQGGIEAGGIESYDELAVDGDEWAANELRVFHHEPQTGVVVERLVGQAELFERGTAGSEDVADGSAIQETPQLVRAKRLLEQLSLVMGYASLRKKLLRFATRASGLAPIERDFSYGHSYSVGAGTSPRALPPKGLAHRLSRRGVCGVVQNRRDAL